MSEFSVTGNPNYAARIVVVRNLVDLPNLDNLKGLPTDGFTALVPKSTEIGSTLAVFPAGSALSEAFAAEHGLFRHSEKNKTPGAVGYLDDNGKVKALKLRGQISSALALPIDGPEGTLFDTIDGVVVSQKWVNPNAKSPQVPGQKKVRVSFDLPEHFDTASWFRNKHLISDDTYVTVTQKLHGCFKSNTKVTMWNGSQKKIVDVVTGDVVVGFRDGVAVPSRVTQGAFTTGRTEVWQKIKFAQRVKGDNPTTFSTPDHKFLTPTGYVRADELKKGDFAFFIRHLPAITPDKESVLTGLMLGDGSTAGGNRNSVEWSHKHEHLEYLEYVRALLGNLTGSGDVQHRTSGYGTHMVCARTIATEPIKRFASKWEGGNVPDDLTLTDLTLAIWYMDDGSLSHHESQQDRANFAICAYNEVNSEHIRNAMIRTGFTNPVTYKTGGYWRLRLNKDDAEYLFSRIRHLVPPSMQYKLPEYHRGFFEEPNVVDREEPVVFNTTVLSTEVVSARDIEYTGKWDIETETHNFVAQRVVVHNSSVRVGRLPLETPLKWWERLLGRTPKKTFVPVIGSRRTIKFAGEPREGAEHFYGEGNDIWSKAGLPIAEVIPDGVMVYAEIIGYVGDTPIQQGYTYMHNPGEFSTYVYRVVVGGFDLSWDALKQFCESRGLKYVPELWRGLHRDFDVDQWMDTSYGGNAVPLDPESPCDEGVTVRAEGITPLVLKAKSGLFLLHEGHEADAGRADIEEEEGVA